MTGPIAPALSGFVAFGLGGGVSHPAPGTDPDRHPDPDETIVFEP